MRRYTKSKMEKINFSLSAKKNYRPGNTPTSNPGFVAAEPVNQARDIGFVRSQNGSDPSVCLMPVSIQASFNEFPAAALFAKLNCFFILELNLEE